MSHLPLSWGLYTDQYIGVDSYAFGGPRSPIIRNFSIRPILLRCMVIRMELESIKLRLTLGPLQPFSEIDAAMSICPADGEKSD